MGPSEDVVEELSMMEVVLCKLDVESWMSGLWC
jgi:hypothetical protein